MSDQQKIPIDTTLLRLMIEDAVKRQLVDEIAPVRTQLQIQEGIWKQFNRDLTVQNALFTDLDELVRGNPKQNLIGLADQIHEQNKQNTEARQHFSDMIAQVKLELSGAITKVKSDLVQKVNEIVIKQDEATKRREALINQARGARWALLALAVVTGLPYLELLGKLLHLVP